MAKITKKHTILIIVVDSCRYACLKRMETIYQYRYGSRGH